MISSSSLSAAQQSDMGAWLSRVYENARVLQSESGAGATQVVRMVTFVLQHLQRDADLASVIADQVLQASRTAACTDWASSALLDMQAIIAGNDLSEALKQRKQATADDKTAAAKLPMDFVQDNRQALVRLLRFSAFKQFLAEAPSFPRDHAESVEHALYLYAKLHAIYPLPGDYDFSCMAYAGFTQETFGEQALADSLAAAQAALSPEALAARQVTLLYNLTAFGIQIWSELSDLLPRDSQRVSQLDTLNRRCKPWWRNKSRCWLLSKRVRRNMKGV